MPHVRCQVVLFFTREPKGIEVVIDGVLLHVVHHDDDLVLQPTIAALFIDDARPRTSSARDLQATSNKAT
jgi:hypothetical protein